MMILVGPSRCLPKNLSSSPQRIGSPASRAESGLGESRVRRAQARGRPTRQGGFGAIDEHGGRLADLSWAATSYQSTVAELTRWSLVGSNPSQAAGAK